MACTTPHGVGALKTGIKSSACRIGRGVRERRLGLIRCTCDVQVRRHRRLRRRQAVHTSLHVGVALKSGLVVGIVQLLDDVQRVLGTVRGRAMDRIAKAARAAAAFPSSAGLCGGSEGGVLHDQSLRGRRWDSPL